MQAFEYAMPKTLKEAVGLLASSWGETEILAGGTDLVSAMKDQVSTPKRVVSLKHVADLGGVTFTAKAGLRIGAMATVQELLDSKAAQTNYPGLIQACDGIRSEQLRAMGTVGGDLLQRPRCWYYRSGFGLLGEYKGKALVPDGDNRYHAILGNSGPAYFVNPSSLAPMLICLGAKVKIHGSGGEREVELSKFFKSPSSGDEREYDLKPNEILTEIVVPHHANVRMAVYEVRQKEALDWPLAALGRENGERFSGGAGPRGSGALAFARSGRGAERQGSFRRNSSGSGQGRGRQSHTAQQERVQSPTGQRGRETRHPGCGESLTTTEGGNQHGRTDESHGSRREVQVPSVERDVHRS